MDLAAQIAAARGSVPADLVLTNLQLVNVLSGEVYPTEIAISAGRIVGVGSGYTGRETLDLGGRYVAPGLIDAHVHIESSLCTPREFSRVALTHGVTTVITDPHEMANVHGLPGIRYMLAASRQSPLSIFVMTPSCVPATSMETNGATLSAADLCALQSEPEVLGLAEMMNYPGVAAGDQEALAKIEAFKGWVLDGHCPGMTGPDLNAYAAAAFRAITSARASRKRQKLRQGLVIFIREATNARNLRPLLPLVTPANSRRICWCTDDRQPADLLDDGPSTI